MAQVQVITGVERRRRWSEEEKRRIHDYCYQKSDWPQPPPVGTNTDSYFYRTLVYVYVGGKWIVEQIVYFF